MGLYGQMVASGVICITGSKVVNNATRGRLDWVCRAAACQAWSNWEVFGVS